MNQKIKAVIRFLTLQKRWKPKVKKLAYLGSGSFYFLTVWITFSTKAINARQNQKATETHIL